METHNNLHLFHLFRELCLVRVEYDSLILTLICSNTLTRIAEVGFLVNLRNIKLG